MKKKPKKRKAKPSNKSKVKNFAVSSLITITIYIIMFLMAAFICYKADISRDKYFLMMIIVSAVSSLFGGVRLTHINKQKGLINGILGSIPVALITLISAVLFNNGIPTLQTIIPIVTSIAVGAVSGATAINIGR